MSTNEHPGHCNNDDYRTASGDDDDVMLCNNGDENSVSYNEDNFD